MHKHKWPFFFKCAHLATSTIHDGTLLMGCPPRCACRCPVRRACLTWRTNCVWASTLAAASWATSGRWRCRGCVRSWTIGTRVRSRRRWTQPGSNRAGRRLPQRSPWRRRWPTAPRRYMEIPIRLPDFCSFLAASQKFGSVNNLFARGSKESRAGPDFSSGNCSYVIGLVSKVS